MTRPICLQVYISDELSSLIRQAARAKGISMSEWVRSLLANACAEDELASRLNTSIERISRQSVFLMVGIDALLAGTACETPQDDAQATYFGGRKPEDGRIDWRQTSQQIFNLIRAVTDPYPGAFTDVDGSRLMVWWAEPKTLAPGLRRGRAGEILSIAPLVVATGDGALELTRTEWRGAVPPVFRPGLVL